MHQHQQQQQEQHSNRFSSQSAPTELQVIISSCSIAIELLPRKEQQTRTRLKRCNEWKIDCWTKITKLHGTETKKGGKENVYLGKLHKSETTTE